MVQESDTLIGTAFEKILSNYLLARFQPFGREHDLWEVFVNVCDRFQEYISSRSTLKVRWGVGKGNWARIPWIAFFGRE
jgi:hypothetical protein